MTRRLATVLSLCLPLTAGRAAACPCSDDAGASALVREDERYAAALVATSRHAQGHFDAFGRYSALGDAESEWSEELLLRVGLRLPQRLEWLFELGYASYRLRAPAVFDRRTGLGDALLRVRYTLRDQAMPHEGPWPALSLSGLLRAPVGVIGESGVASFGSGGAQLGLGAWELGVGLEASRGLLPWLDLLLAGEGAYRFEDHVLGSSRRLGPRADVMLGARASLTTELATSVALRGRFTSDVTWQARELEGTAERLWSVVLGAAFYEPATRLRSSATLSVDPPWSTLSMGSTAATSVSVALAYGAD